MYANPMNGAAAILPAILHGFPIAVLFDVLQVILACADDRGEGLGFQDLPEYQKRGDGQNGYNVFYSLYMCDEINKCIHSVSSLSSGRCSSA